MALQAEFS